MEQQKGKFCLPRFTGRHTNTNILKHVQIHVHSLHTRAEGKEEVPMGVLNYLVNAGFRLEKYKHKAQAVHTFSCVHLNL